MASTPEVQYVYGDPSTGSLQTQMVYPNGRVLDYGYTNSTLDQAIGRLDSLADDGGSGAGHLEDYQYLGLSTLASDTRANGTALTYLQQTGDTLAGGTGGDQYTGLDQFGRVIDQNWINTAAPTTSTDRFQYGYDADGNVLYRKNTVSAAQSELYHASGGSDATAYDGLNRLTSFERGTLTAGGANGATADTSGGSASTWTLDAIGNWSSSTSQGTRTSNSRNEISTNNGSTFTYDNNGNLTSDGTSKYYYDQWNRLMEVKTISSGTVVSTYEYDAEGRRPTQAYPAYPQNLYYDIAGQVIQNGDPNGAVDDQYVWSPFYVNDMILRDDNTPAPQVGQTSGGSMAATTYYVKVTYVTSGGTETLASTEASLGVSANDLLTVTSPAALSGYTSYNVYVWTSSGGELKQNSSPITLGTNWTEPTTGLTSGAATPVGSLGLSTSKLGRRVWSQSDANHDVTALVSNTGTVLERFEYDPYGTLAVLSPIWTTATESFNWQYFFQGGWRDAATGIYHFDNRDYDPTLGVWIQADPAGYVDGMNKQAFVTNSPVDNVDPLGTKKLQVWYDTAPGEVFGDRLLQLFQYKEETSADALIADMKRRIGEKFDADGVCGNSINELVIGGHGQPGEIDLFDPNSTDPNIPISISAGNIGQPLQNKFLSQIADLLSNNARVEFAVCSAGATPTGSDLQQTLIAFFKSKGKNVDVVLWQSHIVLTGVGAMPISDGGKKTPIIPPTLPPPVMPPPQPPTWGSPDPFRGVFHY